MAAIADAAAARGIWVVADFTYEKLIYEPVAAQPDQGPVRSDARPDRDLQRRVEGLRDDRLALRLGDRSEGSDRAVQRRPGPLDVEHQLDHAEGGDRRADRPAGRRHDDAERVSQAARCGARWLTADPRFVCVKPGGAFYLFPYIADLLSPNGIRSSGEFAEALLKDVAVAVTPGEGFDAPGFFRLSYATSIERLQEGVRSPPAASSRSSSHQAS